MATGGPGGPNLGISKGGGPTIRSLSIPGRGSIDFSVPFAQTDWPLTSAPPYAVDLRTFISSLKLNLLPPVDTTNKPATILDWGTPPTAEYHVSLRSWAGIKTATGELVGVLPIGETSTALPSPRDYAIDLRQWFGKIPPPVVVAALPTGEISTALPSIPDYPVNLRSWIESLAVPPAPPVDTENKPVTILEWGTPPEARRPALELVFQRSLALTAAPVVQVPFVQDDWPLASAYRQPPPTWTFSYNLNLIGKDQLPAGEIISERPPLAPALLQTWLQSVNLALTTVVGAPFAKYDWPLTPAAIRATDLSTWISQTKLLLAVPFKQLDWPLTPAAQQSAKSWTASYNLNLIGQDQLPSGAEITALPPQPPLSAIQLRTWIQTVNLALTVTPPVKPFNQQDWPLNFGPRQPIQIFTASYNQNLINKDQLPTGEIVTELPPRQPQQPTPIFTASYNKNLIAQDQLPVGSEITGLPPQPALSALQLRTWIQFVSLALVTPPAPRPFAQYDWPLNTGPGQPVQVFTAAYNKNLTGQDQLPAGEINTGLPAQQRLAAQTWINAVNLALTTVTALPFNQAAWPLNAGPRQPDRSYGYAFPRALIGQDRLPVRQQDWPLYRPFLQPAYSYTAWYNRNLAGKDRLPIRQMSWPVPPEFRRLSDWIVRTNPNLFVPPIPPPEILPRDPTHLRARGGFELDARGQPSLDQRGAGIDARGPSSVDRRGSDRFNRGRNES